MSNKAAIGVLAILASAGSALAGNIIEPVIEAPILAPPPPAIHDWSGAFAGVFAGAARGTYTLASPSGDGPDVDVDGGIYGIQGGYNFQNNRMVYGIVADVSNGPEGITPQGTVGPFWSCNTGDCNADIETLVTVRGRVGFTSGSALFYATAGVAHAKVSGGIFNSAQQGSGSATGWAASLGAEIAVSPRGSINAEIMHVDVGDIPFGTGLGTEDFYGVGNFNTARIGFNFHF